eukprot:g27901.t1
MSQGYYVGSPLPKGPYDPEKPTRLTECSNCGYTRQVRTTTCDVKCPQCGMFEYWCAEGGDTETTVGFYLHIKPTKWQAPHGKE